MMTSIPRRDTSPYQDNSSTAPRGTPPLAHSPATTTDTGSTVSQRVNTTRTADAHPQKGDPDPRSAPSDRFPVWMWTHQHWFPRCVTGFGSTHQHHSHLPFEPQGKNGHVETRMLHHLEERALRSDVVEQTPKCGVGRLKKG